MHDLYQPATLVRGSIVLFLFLLMQAPVRASSDPCCAVPHDRAMYCDELPYWFDAHDESDLARLFGMPQAHHFCDLQGYDAPTSVLQLNSCHAGQIIRTFVFPGVWGQPTISCQQVITLIPRHDYWIRFPEDVEGICGQVDIPEIEYEEIGCDLISIAVEENIYSVASDVCYKLLRDYDVINWCEYDGSGGARVIRRDEDCNGQPGDEAVYVIRRPDGRVYIDRDASETNVNPPAGWKGTDCDGFTNPAGYWINDLEASSGQPARQLSSTGRWQYQQVVKVFDLDGPRFAPASYDVFCSYDNTQCSGLVSMTFRLNDDCTPDDLTFSVYLDQDNDGSLDSDDIATQVLQGSYPYYQIVGTYPLGDHRLEVRVRDGCGNTALLELPFRVEDCTVPGPVCIEGLSVVLAHTADGGAEAHMRSSSVVASAQYDCSGQGTANADGLRQLTRYTLYRADEVRNGFVMPRDSDQDTVLVLDCDDFGLLPVRLYVWDAADNPYSVQPDGSMGGPNYDYCTAVVEVQDPHGHCTTQLRVSGHVRTMDGEGLRGARLMLTGEQDTSQMASDTEGSYHTTMEASGGPYQLQAQYNQDPMRGVDLYDVVRLAWHLSGQWPLETPYALLAADIDGSGVIDHRDLVLLRDLIYRRDTSWPQGKSWLVMPAGWHFSAPSAPWASPWPEVQVLTPVQGAAVMHFDALKLGDLNARGLVGAARPPVFRQASVQRVRTLLSAIAVAPTDAQWASWGFDVLPQGKTSGRSNFWLGQNYPNPAGEQTTIPFELPQKDRVLLQVYDLTGRPVWEMQEVFPAGKHEINCPTSNWHSGVYLYRLRAGEREATHRMMVHHQGS